VQGTARDVLAEASSRFDKAGYEVINLVHDEILLIIKEENAESALEDAIRIITDPPKWALDLPLAAEGWISKRYRK
jgi:DNA polymerase